MEKPEQGFARGYYIIFLDKNFSYKSPSYSAYSGVQPWLATSPGWKSGLSELDRLSLCRSLLALARLYVGSVRAVAGEQKIACLRWKLASR